MPHATADADDVVLSQASNGYWKSRFEGQKNVNDGLLRLLTDCEFVIRTRAPDAGILGPVQTTLTGFGIPLIQKPGGGV